MCRWAVPCHCDEHAFFAMGAESLVGITSQYLLRGAVRRMTQVLSSL